MARAEDVNSDKTPVQLALRGLREKLGLTQQQFSEALGVTMVTVCRWETSRPPSGYSLIRLVMFSQRSGASEEAELFQKALHESPRDPYERPPQFIQMDDISQRLSRIEAILARLEECILALIHG